MEKIPQRKFKAEIKEFIQKLAKESNELNRR